MRQEHGRALVALTCMIAGLLAASPAQAGANYTIQSVSTTNLGNVASAATGSTVLRADASTGNVSVLSGSGASISTNSVRSVVTLRCGGNSVACMIGTKITITASGNGSNRIQSLSNFTVASGTLSISGILCSKTTTTTSISFCPAALTSSGATGTFFIGYDITVAGNDSGAQTGQANAQFSVTASDYNGNDSRTGTVTANVFRALNIAKTADLKFGQLRRPTSAISTVTLSPSTALVSISGGDATALPGISPSRASFSITGEGGQAISVSLPSSVVLTGPSGALTLTPLATASGAQTLSGGVGGAGSLNLSVGASFPLTAATPVGDYTGVVTVTVQYN